MVQQYKIIRNFLFLIAASMLLFSCNNNKEINCDQYKTGKFYYFTKKHQQKTFIERNDSLQLETNEDGTEPIKSKVVWTGPCTCDMYSNAYSDLPFNETDSIIAATPAHVEIIHTADTFYVCTVKMNVFDKDIDLTDTMYVRK